MRELPILFSGPMVAALLNTKPNAWPAEPIDESKAFKWMTRRTIKDKDIINGFDIDVDGSVIAYIDQATGDSYPPTVKARYQPGDRLWVREAWAANIPGCPNGITYKADHIDPKGDGPANPIKWKPSIHMPKAAARIWLEVVNVRVERLQDITEEDSIKEGFEGVRCDHPGGRWACEDCMNSGWREPPSLEFMETWQALNAKRGYGWDVNPWVWVVEFKRLEVD